jgi:hypothetical protein
VRGIADLYSISRNETAIASYRPENVVLAEHAAVSRVNGEREILSFSKGTNTAIAIFGHTGR